MALTEIVLPPELEEVRETVRAAVEQKEPVTAQALVGTVYTATVVEEKTISYDDAQELLEHFQKKDYITPTGKIKDTMKNALKAGTLELPKSTRPPGAALRPSSPMRTGSRRCGTLPGM